MRLFVALELPDAWRDAALELRSALDAALDADTSTALRWVQPDLLHLTLRFLGEFPSAEVGRLQSALAQQTGPSDIALSLAAVGRFGPPQRTQALWLGVGGDVEGLQALAARVERACVEAGAAPEARSFQPHITLARVRERASPTARRAIAAAIDALAPPASASVRVQEVVLIRSILGSGAPRYEVLSRHSA